VQLHGTVGPARTTVSEIAKIAGVRRATVYNHFPTDLDLLTACSSHWFAENPPPDPEPWAQIPDPARRAGTALGAMYRYYESGREMLENVLRDATLVPALEQILRLKWEPMLEGIVDILAEGWITTDADARPKRRAGDAEIRASIKVALNFFTWQTLAASGLSAESAARLASSWIGIGRHRLF
jgi:AcrR family transcriptional regulator